jgi:hypothetical protein
MTQAAKLQFESQPSQVCRFLGRFNNRKYIHHYGYLQRLIKEFNNCTDTSLNEYEGGTMRLEQTKHLPDSIRRAQVGMARLAPLAVIGFSLSCGQIVPSPKLKENAQVQAAVQSPGPSTPANGSTPANTNQSNATTGDIDRDIQSFDNAIASGQSSAANTANPTGNAAGAPADRL